MSAEPKFHNAPTISVEIRFWQQELLSYAMRILFYAAIVAVIFGSLYVSGDGQRGYVVIYILLLLLLGAASFWKAAPYVFKVGLLLFLIYVLSIASALRAGLGSNMRLFLLVLPFVAAFFWGRRAGWWALAVSMLTMLVFAILFLREIVKVTTSERALSLTVGAWASYTVTLLWSSGFVLVTLNYFLSRFMAALTSSRELAHQLEAQRARAELVTERAQLHAVRMEWAAAFGNLLTSLREREVLVQRVVQEMVAHLDLYQVNLFLTERTGDVLSLVAAAGVQGGTLAAVPPEGGVPPGGDMASQVQDPWQVLIGTHSLLGRVAQSGREQMQMLSPGDGDGHSVRFPLSRVEVAFPLVVQGELLGVLDIHSTEATFSKDDLQLFRIVAGYVTASLDTVRTLAETETQMREIRALYAQYTTASWRSLLEAEAVWAHSVGGELDALRVQALATEAVRTHSLRSEVLPDGAGYLLVVPLISRDVVLGYVAFTRTLQQDDWDQKVRAWIELAAERLALALDNTRLLAQVRRQAYYQEQLNRLDDLVWRNPSTEMIMERGVRELGRFLGANLVQLQLAPAVLEAVSSGDGVRTIGTQPLGGQE